MLYTDVMQTKVGVHFHVKVGPDEVSLYDSDVYAGPYYDVIFSDVSDAYSLIVNLIEIHLPGYLDDDEIEESREYLDYMLEEVERGELVSGNMGVGELGFEFELSVCGECVPKGMN